jgi:hypothetical protein
MLRAQRDHLTKQWGKPAPFGILQRFFASLPTIYQRGVQALEVVSVFSHSENSSRSSPKIASSTALKKSPAPGAGLGRRVPTRRFTLNNNSWRKLFRARRPTTGREVGPLNELMKSIVSPSRKAEVLALALLLGGTAAAWCVHEGLVDFCLTILLVAMPLAVVWLIPNLKADRRK